VRLSSAPGGPERAAIHDNEQAWLSQSSFWIERPTTDDVAGHGLGWQQYSGVISPSPELKEGHHSIPGIMSYENKADPVASPALEVGMTEDVWVTTSSVSECIVSPYAVRWIREQTRAPNYPQRRER
jgi:hypothetical protein